MNPILHLHFAGVLLLALFALNFFLPAWFDWKTELPRLSLINRRIMQVHAMFIAIVVLAIGLLCLTCASDLLRPTRLARAVLAGPTAFWFLRLLAQWLAYDGSLWQGDRWRTVAQVVATGLWTYLTGTFAYALWENVRG